MLTTISLIAAGCALALLLYLYWRGAQAHVRLKDEVERLRVLQRDTSSDVRVRLDEGAKTWEQVEREVRPRVDQLESVLADLSAAVEENLPTLSEARARLESVESRVGEAEADLRAALADSEKSRDERSELIEQAVRTLRNAADERLADLGARLAALEGGGASHPSKAETADSQAQEEEDAALEEGPELDFEVMEDPSDTDPSDSEEAEPVLAGSGDADATSPESRGTPPAKRSGGGGLWVVVLLALVTGLALVLTSL